MRWYRHHLHRLTRLAFAAWLLALALTAIQGCLVQPGHDLATPHNPFTSPQQADEHARHASGCLKLCADAAATVGQSVQTPSFDLSGWAILLLLPALLLLHTSGTPAIAFSTQRRPAPPGPPARLSFVRFND